MKNEKRKYHSNYYNNSFDFNSFVSKSSGDSSNVENSEFYGVNAGILVTSGSQATNSTLSTAGSGSLVIYSTGDITLENSTGKATGAQMVVIEGKNTATVTNSTLECSGKGNRNNVDNCGIMIYQSMSGDAGEGTLENMKNTLILGTIVLVLISMIASYILSKRAMRPMIIAYEKQTEFVQNASHELRTPLTIIQAKQELLLTEPNKKIIEKSEDINLTLKETRRLSKLIKELMELARADNKKIKIEKQSTDINELIKEIVKPYVELAEIQNKKLKLELEYNKKIQINQNKINELFVILLDNSLKYTNEGDTITIRTYAKDGKCNIEVQDTGIGISKEGIKHIFERFYREDKARSRQTGGNGLGLAIAQNIVTLHKGTIKAEHNDPNGTVIKIKI